MAVARVRLGAVGCGGFARFALQHFLRVPGVELEAVADLRPEAARETARRFGARVVEDPEALLAARGVDCIYLATPPHLHAAQALRALRAGKHLLVEKPLALDEEAAMEMIRLAGERGLLLGVDQMQRHNPLFETVKELIDSGLLGAVLHGYFENYASDEDLPPGHWFWNPAQSGGIFIEHGVHFFDLFSGWLGPGRVVAAQAVERPLPGGGVVTGQVQCTVRYRSGPLVNFYHGFHQPHVLDRQELRLLFERGQVTLEGWVPTRLRLAALVGDREEEGLRRILPRAVETRRERFPEGLRRCRGRFKEFDAKGRIEWEIGGGTGKLERYGEMLRDLFADQIAWIRDRSHRCKVTAADGLEALALAVRATDMAREESGK